MFLGQGKVIYLNKVLGQHLLHIIDGLLGLEYRFHLIGVYSQDRVNGTDHILIGDLAHMDNLKGCCLHRKCRRLKDTLVQMFEGGSSFRILCYRLLLRLLLHNHAGNLNQHIRKREQ